MFFSKHPGRNFNSEKIPLADCILLSSGKSERIGHHKAFLPFAENENFLEHVLKIYRDAGIHTICVVLHPDIEIPEGSKNIDNTIFIVNKLPELGRLHSIQCGLNTLKKSKFCFIQNIDNPFISVPIIEKLEEKRMEADYISPVYQDKGGHPILISGKVMNHIRNLTNFDQTLQDVLKEFNKKKVPVDDASILVNINTPEDYKHYFQNSRIG